MLSPGGLGGGSDLGGGNDLASNENAPLHPSKHPSKSKDTLYANEAPSDEPPTPTVCNQPCDSMEANAKVDAMPLTDGMAIILATATGLIV